MNAGATAPEWATPSAGGVSSITGTANQVIASASTGAVTLSLPQSIATSSAVQFGTVSVGTSATTGTTTIQGAGTTTGKSLAIRNSSGTTTAYIQDNGDIYAVGFGSLGTGANYGLRLGDSNWGMVRDDGNAYGNTAYSIVLKGAGSDTRKFAFHDISTASPRLATYIGPCVASSGVESATNITPIINQTSTAGYNALNVNVTETATGSGVKSLLNLQIAGTSKFSVTNTGQPIITTKTPSSASDTGVTGTIAWDASYIYVCTATDTWKRVAIATW